MAMRGRVLVAAAVVTACSNPDPEPAPHVATEPAPTATEVTEPEPKLPAIEPFDTGGDEAATLRDIGAVAAWDAVISRDQFLARRGDRGIVYGRVYRHDGAWFVHDESSPELCLGYRIAPPAQAPISDSDRVVMWGAWTVDGERRWVWRADHIEKLEGGGAASPPNAPLSIRAIDQAPEDAALPSQLGGAGTIAFYVRQRPIEYGRGWSIADTMKGDHAARLLLPGERPPYGGQTPPTDHETWQLQPGTRYVLQVGKFRRREGQPPTLRAESPPLEIRIAPE